MSEQQPLPTNWVSREDLIYCRPNDKDRLEALDDSEVEHIAEKIGDELQETYWLAIGIVLADYLEEDE
jgi:hypothetical protein